MVNWIWSNKNPVYLKSTANHTFNDTRNLTWNDAWNSNSILIKSSSKPSCPCVSIRAVCFQRRVVLSIVSLGLQLQIIQHQQEGVNTRSSSTRDPQPIQNSFPFFYGWLWQVSVCYSGETCDLLERKGTFGLKFRHVLSVYPTFCTYRISYIPGLQDWAAINKYHVHQAMWTTKCHRCCHAETPSSSERPVESKGGSLASSRRLGTNVKISKTIKSTTSMSPQCQSSLAIEKKCTKKNPKKGRKSSKKIGGILSKMKSWLI